MPSLSNLETASLLTMIESWFDRISWGLRLIGSMASGAGLLTLVSALVATRFWRLREIGILRALGARRRQIGLIYIAEFGLLGGAAGLSGGLAAGTLSAFVSRRIDWVPALAGSLGSAALAAFAGWLAARHFLRRKPFVVLREE